MLVSTIDLWPFGYKESQKRLVTITLANIGADDFGNYDYVWTMDEPKPLYGPPISAQGRIYGYDRKAPCVSMLARIVKDYEAGYGKELSDMTDFEVRMCQRLREHASS